MSGQDRILDKSVLFTIKIIDRGFATSSICLIRDGRVSSIENLNFQRVVFEMENGERWKLILILNRVKETAGP